MHGLMESTQGAEVPLELPAAVDEGNIDVQGESSFLLCSSLLHRSDAELKALIGNLLLPPPRILCKFLLPELQLFSRLLNAELCLLELHLRRDPLKFILGPEQLLLRFLVLVDVLPSSCLVISCEHFPLRDAALLEDNHRPVLFPQHTAERLPLCYLPLEPRPVPPSYPPSAFRYAILPLSFISDHGVAVQNAALPMREPVLVPSSHIHVLARPALSFLLQVVEQS
mmetsp:Transcript_9232/g.30834  ORF Transcript_9232/g.30834 Transcript_9232/m.30834 type:complete len:226 (-) Transcript_9232:545-1222(-)